LFRRACSYSDETRTQGAGSAMLQMARRLLLHQLQFLFIHYRSCSMANRNQDYGTQTRRGSQSWRDRDDESRRGSSGSRDYESDESYGRDSDDQSGSTGRYAGYGDFGRGEYGAGPSGWSGQERYGQSGYGQGSYSPGGSRQGNYGQRGYGQGGGYESNYGQGRYGQGGYGSRGPERSRYGEGNYRSEYGYGGSRGWNEPFGEGQQYGSQGEYGSEGDPGQRGYGSQGYGSQGSGSYQGIGGSGMGQHRGKGPKGYQRSDERIKELVCERLRDDPNIDPSDVTVTVQGGKITLEGTVDSRQTKNAIEEVAEQFGTQDVQNNLRIQRAQQGMQSSTEMGKQGKGSSDDNTATKQKQH
jgi:hypothetical protein